MSAIQINTKKHRVVAWPPHIINTTPLGYMRDISGNAYPRDIGRSSVFSDGSVFIQFGDTFSHNLEGDFAGLANNTCAMLVDPKVNPTLLSYTPTKNDIDLNGDSPVPDFIGPFGIPVDVAESHDALRPTNSDFAGDVQRKFWSFSGIVEYETSGDVKSGWTWFEKREITPEDPEGYIYTGIAQVNYRPTTQRIYTTINRDHRLFEKNEPGFGGFCAVGAGKEVFVYGHMPGSKDVAVGRVPSALAGERRSYRFLTGYGPDGDGLNMLSATSMQIFNGAFEGQLNLTRDGVWSDQIKDCLPVQGLQNMQHGQIFKMDMYTSCLYSSWAFVGCNATGDSQVVIGRSRAPEGPFTTVKLMSATPLLKMPSNSYAYCMYPHPWASDLQKGDLMLSWSEGSMNGNVVAVIVRLKTVRDGEEAVATSVTHTVET